MDELICPHCDDEITELRRTGNKRYSCTGCSKVVKHDLIKPYLEEDAVEVNDMRDEVGKDKEEENNNSNSSSKATDDTNPSMSQSTTPDDREIIRQEGRQGLKRIKKRKLEDWLQSTDGVGGKTLNRVLMVFEEEDMYSEEPDTLFSLLDDELNATSSYINTIVNSVFSPEYDHQDLLQEQGYEPFFAQGGQRQGTGTQDMNRGNNRGQNQNHRQQPTQQGGQAQQQSGGNDLTREEALQMIQAAQSEDDSGSRRRGPATDALDAATEEAIQNMASNMGGFFGMAQNLMENTLMAYFEENPEKLVENMDLIQTFMQDDESSTSTQQQTQSRSQEDEKIDNALDGIREQQGLDTNESGGSTDSSDDNPAFREPSRDNEDTESSNETDESSFEPDPEIMEGGGADPETQGDAPVTQDNNWNTANGAEPNYDEPETQEQDNKTSSNTDNDDTTNKDDGEEDWFDQEFGEVGAEG